MTFCVFSIKVYPSTCIKYRSSEKVGLDYDLFGLNTKLFQNNMVQEYQPEKKTATKNAVVSEFIERELFCFLKSGAN